MARAGPCAGLAEQAAALAGNHTAAETRKAINALKLCDLLGSMTWDAWQRLQCSAWAACYPRPAAQALTSRSCSCVLLAPPSSWLTSAPTALDGPAPSEPVHMSLPVTKVLRAMLAACAAAAVEHRCQGPSLGLVYNQDRSYVYVEGQHEFQRTPASKKGQSKASRRPLASSAHVCSVGFRSSHFIVGLHLKGTRMLC